MKFRVDVDVPAASPARSACTAPERLNRRKDLVGFNSRMAFALPADGSGHEGARSRCGCARERAVRRQGRLEGGQGPTLRAAPVTKAFPIAIEAGRRWEPRGSRPSGRTRRRREKKIAPEHEPRGRTKRALERVRLGRRWRPSLRPASAVSRRRSKSARGAGGGNERWISYPARPRYASTTVFENCYKGGRIGRRKRGKRPGSTRKRPGRLGSARGVLYSRAGPSSSSTHRCMI